MSTVLTDANPAPSTGNQEVATLETRVEALRGDALDNWKLNGNIDAAEALSTKSDVKADPSSATPETGPESGTGKQEPQQETAQDRNWANIRKENAALKVRLDLLEREKAAASGTSAPAARKEEAQQTAERQRPDFPDIEKFDSVADWNKAVAEWKKADEEYIDWKMDQREQRQSQTRTVEQIGSQWNSQADAARTKYKDFDAVAFNPNTPASFASIPRIQQRKDGAEIAYYLGQHPEEAQRIAQLTDIPEIRTDDDFAALQKKSKSDPTAAALLARVEAIADLEFDRISGLLTNPAAQKTIPRIPRPSNEVAVSARGTAVEDLLAEAVKNGDQEAFNRLENEKETRRWRGGSQ